VGTYLYRIWPDRPELLVDGPTSDEERSIGEHYEYLKDLTARGIVLLAGRTRSETIDDFGIVVLVAESAAVARAIMLADPAVRDGVFVGDLFPYDLAMVSGDIGRHAGTAA